MKKVFFFLITLFVTYNISFAAEIESTCKRYFDGCNNCSRAVFWWEMACTMMACVKDESAENSNENTAKCLEYFTETEMKIPTKACTREYMPVCAQPQMPACPEGMMCAQVMPALKTYGNKCSAEAENAEVISEWACSEPTLLDESWVSEWNVWWSSGEDVKICTMEYAPVCGEKQVQCIKAPCNPIKQTYSNKCMASWDNATFLYNGNCVSEKLETQIKTKLYPILAQIEERKKVMVIQRVIMKIDVLLQNANLSENKISILNVLKYLLK